MILPTLLTLLSFFFSYHDLEMNFQKLVSKHEGVLREMERLKLRLNDEERHNISVQVSCFT